MEIDYEFRNRGRNRCGESLNFLYKGSHVVVNSGIAYGERVGGGGLGRGLFVLFLKGRSVFHHPHLFTDVLRLYWQNLHRGEYPKVTFPLRIKHLPGFCTVHVHWFVS
jgi:hypothetical protein